MEHYEISPQKILRHPDEIEFLRRGKVPSVLNVEVDLSEACNLRCRGCDFPQHYDAFMTFERAVATVDVLKSWGTQAVVLTGGGEPTLCPDFAKIVRLLSKGFALGMYTNGTQDNFPEHAELFDWVFVSLDAPDDATWAYSKRAKRKDFHRVLDNIRQAAKETTVGVGYLIHMGNYHRVEEMAALGLEVGSYVHFRPLFPTEDTSWRADAIPYLERVSSWYNVTVAWDKFHDLWRWRRDYTTCWASMFIRLIDAEGTIWACPTTRWKRKLGTIDSKCELKSPLKVTPECRALCRGHGMNKILDYIMHKGPHDAFV